jgi:glycine betaine/proline transport system ATP-binding protein
MNEPRSTGTSDEIALRVEDVWKVFGPEPEVRRLLASDRRDGPKDEILEKTGCVVGVRNIDFAVRKGEFFVLMGLSGSGKSTLIRCLIRLVDPSRGRILYGDRDICGFDARKLREFRRRETGMVFQHYGLLPHYSVLDNVAYGLKIGGTAPGERRERALRAIETVGLKGWEDHFPSSLSGGMQQRVGMARALAREPRVLLLDEPFSGLDPLIRRQMQDELVDLQTDLRKTMIFVTHDLHEALKLGDRIAIMKDGEIIQLGTPEDIIAEPADDYVRSFVRDASPAKVLTAGRIMEEPDLVIHEWQGPKTTRALFRSAREDYAFFLTRKHEFRGLLRREDVRELARKGAGRLEDILIADAPTCVPDTVVETLFPLAAGTPHPISVVDERNRFRGAIFNRTILDCMYPDEAPEAVDPAEENPDV